MRRSARALSTAVLSMLLAMGASAAAADVAHDPDRRDTDSLSEIALETETRSELASGELEILESDEFEASLLNTESSAAARTNLSTGGKWVICSARPDSPHYSKGAKGAIYKVRITCTGTGYSYVTVKVNCSFMYRSYFATSWQRTVSSAGSTSVKVNGDRGTVYCPASGSLGTGTGYWQGSGTYRITWPGTGALGTYASLWGGSISAR